MKLCTKICLWTGGLLLAAGAVLFVCGMAAKNWDFDKLATVRYEQQEYVAQSDVTDVVLNFDVSGIRIVQDKNTQKMTCSYPVAKDLVNGKSAQVTTSEEDGVLTVTEKKLGFSLFRWDTDTPTLVLTVPENTASLSVSTGVGDIELDGLTAEESIFLKTDVGKIVCKNVTAEKIELHSGVGDITAENCSANGTLTIDGDVCNVQMKDLDGGKISVNTNLGDISLLGSLSAAQAEMTADTGSIDLSKGTTDAQSLALSTALGDISAFLTGMRADYAAEVTWDVGESNLYPSESGTRTLKVSTSCGSIHVSFAA